MTRCHCFVLGVIVYAAAHAAAASDVRVPILVYHRFGPLAQDNMTVTTEVFAAHLRYLSENAYRVIPARDFVDFRLGKAPPPPPNAVVITADDGHRSVFTEMLPLVLRYRVPVTLFIYPSAISNADYALTWDQLRELQRTGLFDIQSHTYWHPNFSRERRRLSASEYERFVAAQLTKSRDAIREQLGIRVDMLAWPFGIHDPELARWAAQKGYVAAFTLERRPAEITDNLMALPRLLITNADRGKAFERLLRSATCAQPGAVGEMR